MESLVNVAFYRGYKLVDTLGGTTIAHRSNAFAAWQIISRADSRDAAKAEVDSWLDAR
jgi:hypothetical protein